MKTEGTFAGLLAARAHALPPRVLEGGECRTQSGEVCSLCHAARLTYTQELEAKRAALADFSLTAGVDLDELIPSPAGRSYRVTTKRKAFRSRRGIALGLIDPEADGRLRALEVRECAIEPAAHGRIHGLVRDVLADPASGALAGALRHVVVRGAEEEQIVILTVAELSAPVFRSAKHLSRILARRVPTLAGAFLYEDQTRGTHYLGSAGAGRRAPVRKIFGQSELFVRVAGRPFLFSPLVFSQVNAAILGRMVETVGALLDPDPGGTLYDLYCGYGLFGLSLADRFRRVLGVEVSGLSVEAARRNAVRQHAAHARFIRDELTAGRVGGILGELGSADRVLLDPPRSGAAPGVIEAAAARGPRRAVHIVCAIDLLPRELRRWRDAGYRAVGAVPLDMFPGTDAIETVVALERG